jgi:hypothetical protein
VLTASIIIVLMMEVESTSEKCKITPHETAQQTTRQASSMSQTFRPGIANRMPAGTKVPAKFFRLPAKVITFAAEGAELKYALWFLIFCIGLKIC